MKALRDPLILTLLALLFACNAGLVTGIPAQHLTFQADRVLAGEWWRLLTHPFVHVSGYHLLLDAGSLLLLLGCLRHLKWTRQARLLLFCGIGSLLAALCSRSEALASGFCGLSGIAHGVMTYVGLDMAERAGRDRTLRVAGYAISAATVCKGLWEAAGGGVFFAAWHPGYVGIPIAACHAGGIAAGLLLFVARSQPPARGTVSSQSLLPAPGSGIVHPHACVVSGR